MKSRMQETQRSLDGQQVLVVGGSSGIGLAAAAAARAAGAHVTLAGRSAERLTRAAASLAAASVGGDVRTAQTDIADTEAYAMLLDTIATPDHLVITAGALSGGLLATLDAEVLDAAWRERAAGPVALLRAVVARRVAHSLPRLTSVTLTSGLYATRPVAGAALMSALCAAVEGLTAALALELAPTRVNAIAPGYTNTPLLDVVAQAVGAESGAALAAGATVRQPVPRAGTADELGEAVLFAMTNGYLTGATLRVDGGARWA
ncbi:MAG TPA: SDR family oxidoreductase [Gemmatimonadaceae bacterium]|nr:SDR family oxidoreductase [Gemmatimonadaceae bacterium]